MRIPLKFYKNINNKQMTNISPKMCDLVINWSCPVDSCTLFIAIFMMIVYIINCNWYARYVDNLFDVSRVAECFSTNDTSCDLR